MKLVNLLFTFIPATMAAECLNNGGCTGCGVLVTSSFVQTGNSHTATSPSHGSVAVTPGTIVRNTSNKWLLFCVYGVLCAPLEAGDSCTTSIAPSTGNLWLEVWGK
ncbi:hypothetical protein HJFPF1_12294 [Paramyrothecium foliicola]|nr:hypothetical protein HJFPF1_12294 [Paramyrothecium foliicola]